MGNGKRTLPSIADHKTRHAEAVAKFDACVKDVDAKKGALDTENEKGIALRVAEAKANHDSAKKYMGDAARDVESIAATLQDLQSGKLKASDYVEKEPAPTPEPPAEEAAPATEPPTEPAAEPAADPAPDA